jgi:O-antigen ligase
MLPISTAPNPVNSAVHRAVFARWIMATLASAVMVSFIFFPGFVYCHLGISLLLAGGLIYLAWQKPHSPNRAHIWLLWFFVPVLSVIFLQACPFGVYHPIMQDDITALGYQPTGLTWSVDALRSREMFAWLTLLCAWGIFLARLSDHYFRRDTLAFGFVILLASSALIIICYEFVRSSSTPNFVKGPFAYHNHAGVVWAMGLPLALFCALRHGAWAWILPAILALALFLSASRTAIGLGFFLSFAYLMIIARARQRLMIAGICLGFIGCAALLSSGFTAQRFADLAHGQAETVNGRTLIWERVLPLLSQVSWFGYGAGTTPIVMQRAAGIDVTGKIDHVHSEPLELLLDFGVLGCCIMLIAFAIATYFYRHGAHKLSRDDQHLSLALVVGLIAVLLHACTDYILRSGAVNVIALTLLVLLLSGWRHTTPNIKSARWLMLVVAIIIIPLGLFLTLIQSERLRSNDHAIMAMAPTNLVLTADYAAAQALHTATLSGAENHDAKVWLAMATQRSLSSLATWHAHGFLALEAQQLSPAITAAERMMMWAPDHELAQQFTFRVLEITKDAATPRTALLAQKIIHDARARTITEWELLASHLGKNVLMTQLRDHNDVVTRRSALPWVRQHADLSAWEHYRAQIPFLYPLDPIQVPVVQETADARPYSVALYDDKEKRRTQAERCLHAGFPFAPTLRAALKDDGQVGATYLALADYRAQKPTTTLIPLLTQQLHYPWAKYWWDTLRDQENAEQQLFSRLDASRYPPTLWLALQSAKKNNLLEQEHKIRAWLTAYQLPQWHDVGWGIRWTWLFVTEQTPALTLSDGWTGVYLNRHVQGRQEWQGWHNHQVPPSLFTAGQFYHVVLVDPP